MYYKMICEFYCGIDIQHLTKFPNALMCILRGKQGLSDDNCPPLCKWRCANINADRTAIISMMLYKLCNTFCHSITNQTRTREPTKTVVGSTQQLLKFKDHPILSNKIAPQTQIINTKHACDVGSSKCKRRVTVYFY